MTDRKPHGAGRRNHWFVLHPSAFILLFLVPGCARYEYDVVEPPALAGHVGDQSWAGMRRDELEYRMRSADNRLVMLVYNRGERTIKLLGSDSAAIDPHGESHPLQSSTIPPGSFAKRIFPPPPPTLQTNASSYGVGVGVMGGAYATHFHGGTGSWRYADPYLYGPYPYGYVTQPRYYTVYDPNDLTFFDWSGESTMRFQFVYQREGGETIRHEWVIRRKKM